MTSQIVFLQLHLIISYNFNTSIFTVNCSQLTVMIYMIFTSSSNTKPESYRILELDSPVTSSPRMPKTFELTC